jgi:hypothetical protein
MKITKLTKRPYYRVEDRFIDSGIPYEQQPVKIHEGPPYDVASVEYILELVSGGLKLSSILEDDPSLPRMGELMGFLRRNPEWWDKYLDARAAQAEVFREKIQEAIDPGDDSISDVQRDRLKFDGYKWLAAVSNRDLYGDKKQIDVNQKLDLSAAMQAAEKRVETMQRGVTLEGVLDDEHDDEPQDDTLKVLGLE